MSVGVEVCVADFEVDTDVDALVVNVPVPLVDAVLGAVVLPLEVSVIAFVELADVVADKLSVDDRVLDGVDVAEFEIVLDTDDVAEVARLAVDTVDDAVVVTVVETEFEADDVALELSDVKSVVLAELVSVEESDFVNVELAVELTVEISHPCRSPLAHSRTAVLNFAIALAQLRGFTINPPGVQLNSFLWLTGALLKLPKNFAKSVHCVSATVTYVCARLGRQVHPSEVSTESSDLQLS